MYLHIGSSHTLRRREIVGIFDLDTASVSAVTKEFLKKAENEKRTVTATEDLPKSFLVTEDGKVYFSQISSGTLNGR